MTVYTTVVQEDEQGQFITFPDEMMEEAGWKEGDQIQWIDNGDGSFTLKKVDRKWVMVDTIVTYRMRYMVEAPADHPEYALDTVTCEEAKEFSQLCLGEQIVGSWVVSDEQALKICDQENDYCGSWNDEMKKNAFFTTMEEQGYDTVDHSEHYFDTERNK